MSIRKPTSKFESKESWIDDCTPDRPSNLILVGDDITPKFLNRPFGYCRKCYLYDNTVLVVKYIPIGLQERDDNCLYACVLPTYSKETNVSIAKRVSNQHSIKVNDDFIYSTERLKHCFKSIMETFIGLNLMWQFFPSETDYNNVKILFNAKKKYDALKFELATSSIEKCIKSLRQRIKSLKSDIVRNEQSLRKIYEDAADALNFLEEHGYRQEDLDKKQEIIEDSKYFDSVGCV